MTEREYAREFHKTPKQGKEKMKTHENVKKVKEQIPEQETSEEEYIQGHKASGKIIGEILRKCDEWVKPGIKLIDLADKIEGMIKEKVGEGGGVAFPANLSLNSIAAHYTPTRDDETIFTDKDMLKVDIGAHVDGYVADAARTFCFDPAYDSLKNASKKALEEAIKLCKPGTNINELSEVIEEAIKSFGYKPIQNLTGHGVGQYIVHMEPSIPNIKHPAGKKLEEGMVIAIEPFATDGEGRVKDSNPTQIYRIMGQGALRGEEARQIVNKAVEWYGLPFAERWIDMKLFKMKLGLRELNTRGMLHEYPPLKESGNGMVSQHEHTIIIKDEPIVTTRF